MLKYLFFLQIIFLLICWWFFFRHPLWNQNNFWQSVLFLAPFFIGSAVLWGEIHYFSVETIRTYHNYIYCYSTLNALLLLPSWYKLMWVSLIHLPIQKLTEGSKLLFSILFAIVMVLAIIFFFTLYFLWLDSLSGYAQGLRSALLNYQPILLDFATAFYFSFVCYFSLGYGDLVPFGLWFQLLVFLECLISLLNTGIIVIYVFRFLFDNDRYS